MYARKKYEYIVTLHGSDGQTVEEPFRCFWSPNYEGVLEEVAKAAAATKNIATRRIAAAGKVQELVEWLGVTARYEKTVKA